MPARWDRISILLWFDWQQWLFERTGIFREFQFHYGSIDRFSLWRSAFFFTAFQFHYGSIDSGNHILFMMTSGLISIPLWFDWQSAKEIVSLSRCMISIPLWFDWQACLSQLLCRILPFQFHYGSIDRWQNGFQSIALHDFNSTMVRLTAYSLHQIPVHFLFQFHYGSIDSITTSQNIEGVRRFQFHYGSIDRMILQLLIGLNLKFQFHYGSIDSR